MRSQTASAAGHVFAVKRSRCSRCDAAAQPCAPLCRALQCLEALAAGHNERAALSALPDLPERPQEPAADSGLAELIGMQVWHLVAGCTISLSRAPCFENMWVHSASQLADILGC